MSDKERMKKWTKAAKKQCVAPITYIFTNAYNSQHKENKGEVLYAADQDPTDEDNEMNLALKFFVEHINEDYTLATNSSDDDESGDNNKYLELFNDHRFGNLLINDNKFWQEFVDDVVRPHLGTFIVRKRTCC
jgi:hypothetical protein